MERIVVSEDLDNIKLTRTIERLCERFTFIQKFSIGKSCLGRDITALSLGRGEEYVLFAAAFHGSEHITSNILLYFLEELCYAYKQNVSIVGVNARKGLFGRGVIFVPCVNPDGCEISIHGISGCSKDFRRIQKLCSGDFAHWNANFRGVDINHNFPAGFEDLRELEKRNGIYGPAPTRFGGYSPESEPETKALTALCRGRRIRHVIALHSQGEVIYWSYGEKKPRNSEKMAHIMATSSGYALDVPVGLAYGGGFKDWFIDEFSRPGFTVEMGLGKNPLPIKNAMEIYQKAREMLTISAIM